MFSRNVLRIDPEQVVREIEATIREVVLGDLRRRGAVVGLSGGIDSCRGGGACARARSGRNGSLGLFMPERDSSDDALRLGRMLADAARHRGRRRGHLAALAGAGCYARQDEAIRTVFPEYGEGWRCKLALPSILEGDGSTSQAHRGRPGR